MKYLLAGLMGFLLGAAAAGALLYVNPLTQRGGRPPIDGDTVYSYASPITAGLAFSHGAVSRLPSHPAGIPDLWEGTIYKSALSLLVLQGADGDPAAIASRYSYPAEDTELLSTGAILSDAWIVSLPGQGSVFVSARSNWWPLLEDAVIPVWYLGRPWRGPSVYLPTVGPGPGGQAIVHGATGAFAGLDGQAAERYQIEAFDDRVGPQRVHAELYWALANGPEPAAGD